MNTTSTIRSCVAPLPLTAPRRADSVCAPRGAFTLAELVVVVAVISLLCAIAIPRFGGAIGNYCLDAASRKIIADLSIARVQAMTASAPQSVVFAASGASYTLTGMASLDSRAKSYVIDLTNNPYIITTASANFGGTRTVTFNMYGIPDNGGSVLLQKGSSKRTVTLDAATGKATFSP